TQRPLADWPLLVALSAKELVKEIAERTFLVPAVLIATAPMRRLDSRLSIDIDHCGLDGFCDLRKLIGKLARRRYGQRRRISGSFLFLLSLYTVRDHGADQNSDRQREQNDRSE